jgi:prepilin-type N-terminal cleavage/methylation domain-containing protein
VQGAIQDPPHLHKKTGTKGFTLVELIVAIVILGILLAIAIPALTGYIAKAQDKEWEASRETRFSYCKIWSDFTQVFPACSRCTTAI